MNIDYFLSKRAFVHLRVLLIPVIMALHMACEPKITPLLVDSERLVITEFIEEYDDRFGEFGKLLKATGFDNLLKTRGPFTLILPDNNAMNEYYQAQGIASHEEMDLTNMVALIYNHLFATPISRSSIPFGAIPDSNILGGTIVSVYQGTTLILNRTSRIIESDIFTANGIIHVIDRVMEPVTHSVFQALINEGAFTIFVSGLEKAGLKDTLNLFSFPYGNFIARAEYTLLAVPDTVYNRYGINSIDDLIALHTTDTDLTNPENGFHEYMVYHCLTKIYHLNNFSTHYYPVISMENWINFSVTDAYRINFDNVTNKYTGIYLELSNIPARNGTVHVLNSPLEMHPPTPVAITYETTDFPDVKAGPWYRGGYYQRFTDGMNTFQNIKWRGDYLLYYKKPNNGQINDDCVNINNHFWIEIKFPKVPKGKYEVKGHFFLGNMAYPTVNVVINGVYQLEPVNLSRGQWGGPPVKLGEMVLEQTAEPIIRLETIVPGQMFWDHVLFIPIP